MRRGASMAWFLAAAAAAGCGVGEGEGAVDGAVFIRQCAQRNSVGAAATANVYAFGEPGAPVAYSMHPSFFAAEAIDDFPRLLPRNRLNVRVQSDGSRIEMSDVLFFNVTDTREVAFQLGQDMPVGPNTNVRATLSLNQSCPSPEALPALEGTIRFTQFGDAGAGRVEPNFRISWGDQLQATFSFRVIDVRAATLGGLGSVPIEPAVGGELTGFFDFIVRQGQRAQSYP